MIHLHDAALRIRRALVSRIVRAGWFGLVTIAASSAAGCGSDEGSGSPGVPNAPSPDSGTPAGQDGGAPPADAAAATDAGTGCTTGLSVPGNDEVPCGDGTSCASTDLCCMSGQGACRAKSSGCLGGEKELGCTSSNGLRCATGTMCCLAATSAALASLKTSTTCPAPLRFADFSNTACFAACTGNRLPACQADGECPGGTTCHAVLFVEAFAPITIGVCY